MPMRRLLALAAVLFPALLVSADPPRGFYRQPALRDGTIVFSAEGDLWLVSVKGGEARRLTTHHGEETFPTISPDGATLAFCGQYEGPTEIYTMPLTGGPPLRRTFTGGRVVSVGWTDDGKLLYGTDQYSTLPGRQLVLFDPQTNEHELLPLAQAADGCFDGEGTLYFTRWPSQGSHTKRYQGGTAQDIWRFAPGDAEARCLTCDYHGTNRNPMFHEGRVYFETDRSGAMNIWSMRPDGSDLKQHTRHVEWEVKSPALDGGRIVYRLGTDLRLYDIARDRDQAIAVHLAGDFDQSRERWLEKPLDYVSDWDLSPDGSQLVLTARGEIFVISTKHDRRLRLTRDSLVRYRQAQFLPDGEAVLALSDETGELEFWSLPLDPTAARKQLSRDGDIFRTDGTPSPDGKWLAFQDKKQILWLLDIESGSMTRLAHCPYEVFAGLTWSPDSRLLAFAQPAKNTHPQIKLYDTQTETTIDVTSDRTRSFSPTFTADGAWLYFLSDRHFRSSVSDPWGFRQPEPYFEKTVKLYGVSLTAERRSPFAAEDELTLAADDEGRSEEAAAEGEEAESEEESAEEEEEAVEYDLAGLTARCFPVPVPPGNYSRLAAGTEALFYMDVDNGEPALLTLPIQRQDAEPKTVIGGVSGYLLSDDRNKLLLRKGSDFSIVDAGDKVDFAEGQVNLSDWRFSIDPREEWRQMLIEAWRLERDYFYDPDMHGVDWPAMLEKYLPLADRVSYRAELSDLLGQMISELSALHMYVFGGDHRGADTNISQGFLGARLARQADRSYRVEHIYQVDPNYPERRSPLAQPGIDVEEGDYILAVNGEPVVLVSDIGILLRDQAGKPVRLTLERAGESHDVITTPTSSRGERNLRYEEWEYTRRLLVEELSGGRLGYVHLRAMGGGDIAQWTREFYPAIEKEGLIVDCRHNGGGNIDSWILEKLMRKVWFYWKGRVGDPTTNMQYAFKGHMITLCNEQTASDGEAFVEGFRRLGLGKILGTRTWGGEIWLSFSTPLVDRGMASAAEWGVYGPEGEWLIEGWGVEPDIVVDNLPHATFLGEDAQLRAAVQHLLDRLEEDPVIVPAHPPYPDKSGPENR